MSLATVLLATVLSLSGEWEFRREGGSWEKVQVPHDWAIAGPFNPDGDPDTGKLPWCGKGEYRKKVKVGGEGEERDLRHYLCFDGVMARPEVFVNGEKAGGWDYGYAPFELDVTKLVRPGENEIVVRCDTTKQRSRWYPGAGIYRNVRLETVGTDDVIPNTMRIVATVDGKVEVSYRTPKGERRDSFTVKDPVLWSPENPHLYVYEVNGRKFRYGFRSIEFTADDGFHLNGKRLQIKGVNLHSDLGPLGMAFDRDAAERQLRIMMEMGANAIRTAHNPPAAELLDLCDELGLIVWEELFDKWEDTAGRLPDEDLIEYISRNTKTAVRRDRNHPCVVVWSLGDEIPYGPDEDPSGMTRERLATLRDALREEDVTRPVGTGNNRKTMRADVFRDLDLTGWNYRHSYAAIRKALPGKPIVYSESASCVSENGWYDMLAPTGKLDTAYDRFRIDGHECNAPTWADVPEVEFLRMERDRFVAGEFVWTGIDYLGEPSPYSSWYLTTRAKRPPITNAQSSRSSYFGICDLCGFPKNRYWIYRAHWRKDVHTLRLLPHWNWEGQEGKDVDVTVITDCDEAELLLDGKSFGRKLREPVPADYPLHHVTNSPTYYDATRLCRYRWRIPYRPGCLTARGYADGRARIAVDTITAGKPEKLLFIPERCGGRLEFVQVYAADGKGIAHPLADNRVRFRVEGPGEIAAVCNGDARDLDSFKSDGIRLFGGKAQVIVRRTGPGGIRLTASSPGLSDAVWEFGKRLAERTDRSFTLASFNVRAAAACDLPPNFWTERAPRIAKIVQNRGFDIVGLQEAERRWCVRLAELLPGWKYVYAGREADGEGESASFMYDSTRFCLVTSGTFWLSETPDVPGSESWDTACPRTCTWGRFTDRRTGKDFFLFNTHLDCGPNSAQTGGMKLILERIRAVRRETGLPVFLTGDMNTALGHKRQATGPDHPLVMAAQVLKESWNASEMPHTGPVSSWVDWSPHPYGNADGQIDHIFVSDDVRVLSSATCADYPDGLSASDHFSVSCEVELNGGRPAEEPYAFRKRLECVHEKDRRDPAATCAADELEVKDGFSILLPKDASDFTYRVVRDFEDYLAVSMGVMSQIRRDQGVLRMSVDASLREREYRIEVDANGIRVSGRDERALAQAFYRLEDRMNLRGGPFLRHGIENRRPRFAVRMTHSGYKLSEFPDAHLSQMAHAGMTAIMLFLQDVDVVEGTRSCDVRTLIRRAKGFGLDTYLYSCIPTFIHPDDGDAAFDESYGRIAGAYPEAKGLVIVGESCQFPSKDQRVQPVLWGKNDPKDKRPLAGWFPCADYPDWVRAVQRALAKKAPDMKLVFWTYNWGWAPEKDRLALIDALPRNVVLQATFEMFERQLKRNGLESPTADYSLSLAGPGRYFATEAAAARKHGLALFTQANAGGRTWDFGTAPYEPFPFQWRARWDALVRAHDDWGLSGVMENHHYGWTPTFIAELEKEAYTEGGIPFDEHIRQIAARDFGAKNVDKAVAAWKAWSDAMRDYVPTDLNQYGPFRCGPAYPYAAGRGPVDAKDFPVTKQSLVGTGFIRMDYLKHGFVPELTKEDSSPGYMRKEIELLDSMVAAFESGARDFDRMKGAKAAAMGRLGHYLAAICRTARNVKRGAVAESEKDEAAILAAARDEYANATAALSLVEADSHLGWEPEMDYVGGPDQIRWKLRLMEKIYGAEALK